MTEEEQRDYDAFSLASVSVPKRPWRTQEDSNVSKPQPQPRRDDLDSLYNEEEFSIDVDNEAVLREKQARSEALYRVAEFCNLDRQDPQIQKEVMGMRLQV